MGIYHIRTDGLMQESCDECGKDNDKDTGKEVMAIENFKSEGKVDREEEANSKTLRDTSWTTPPPSTVTMTAPPMPWNTYWGLRPVSLILMEMEFMMDCKCFSKPIP